MIKAPQNFFYSIKIWGKPKKGENKAPLKNNNVIEPDLCNDQKQPHMKEQKLDIGFKNLEYDHVNNFIFFESCPSFTN